jgi:hypothetical protein
MTAACDKPKDRAITAGFIPDRKDARIKLALPNGTSPLFPADQTEGQRRASRGHIW